VEGVGEPVGNAPALVVGVRRRQIGVRLASQRERSTAIAPEERYSHYWQIQFAMVSTPLSTTTRMSWPATGQPSLIRHVPVVPPKSRS